MIINGWQFPIEPKREHRVKYVRGFREEEQGFIAEQKDDLDSKYNAMDNGQLISKLRS